MYHVISTYLCDVTRASSKPVPDVRGSLYSEAEANDDLWHPRTYWPRSVVYWGSEWVGGYETMFNVTVTA